MAARSGCSYLVDFVRTLTNAGTGEYSLGTANFWDDDHIQWLLDEHRRDIERFEIPPIVKYLSGGSVQYLRYQAPFQYLEGTTSNSASAGTAIYLEDATGADITTYTADFQRGLFTFSADTLGTAYFLTGRCFDPYGAAADLLESWAALLSRDFDFQTSGLAYKRNQAPNQLLAQAQICRQKQWAGSVQMVRLDTC